MDTCPSPQCDWAISHTHLLLKLSHIGTVLSFTSENMYLLTTFIESGRPWMFSQGNLNLTEREDQLESELFCALSSRANHLLISFHSFSLSARSIQCWEQQQLCCRTPGLTKRRGLGGRSGWWCRGQKSLVWSIGCICFEKDLRRFYKAKTGHKGGISFWRRGHKSLVGSIGVLVLETIWFDHIWGMRMCYKEQIVVEIAG